jgi:DNA-directed RNA polymerase specialized sigma24 family protein
MMTPEQRRLVEANHHIIYSVLKKFGMPASEYYDVIAERICKAAISFKGEPGQFFSYAYRAAVNGVMSERRKAKRFIPYGAFEIKHDGPEERVEGGVWARQFLDEAKHHLTHAEYREALRLAHGERFLDDTSRRRAIAKLRRLYMGEKLPRASPRLPPEECQKRNDAIVRLRYYGYSDEQVAAKYGLKSGTVREIYAKAGSPRSTTATATARELGVDRSTILRHAKGATKNGACWHIPELPEIRRPYRNYSKEYSPRDMVILRSPMSDEAAAKYMGRSVNAIHIKRWRMRKEQS